MYGIHQLLELLNCALRHERRQSAIVTQYLHKTNSFQIFDAGIVTAALDQKDDEQQEGYLQPCRR